MARFIKVKFIFIAVFLLILSTGISVKAEQGDIGENKNAIETSTKDEGEKEELINEEQSNSDEGIKFETEQYIDSPVDEESNDTEQTTEESQANADELDLIGEPEEDTQTTTNKEELSADSVEQIDSVVEEINDTGKAESASKSEESDSIKQQELTDTQVQVAEEKKDTEEEPRLNAFQVGERHEDTIKLKQHLSYLGFHVSNNPTSLYGPVTESKVKAFQKKYGLEVTGVADQETWRKIEELLASPMKLGIYRKDVVELKDHLKVLGFRVSNNPTIYFGAVTEAKVQEFQKYYGLSITGIADKSTLDMISQILSSPFQNGKRDKGTKKLKSDLAKLGFAVPGKGTELYGTNTESRVKELQSYYNLKVNGIADHVTLEKMKSILSSPLQYGRRHNDTKKLKSDLKKLGFSVSGNGTTLFAAKTEKKMREFQSYYGLVPNGIADEVTLNQMAFILSSPLQKGKRHKETVKLKKDLGKLNYFVSANPTTLYGAKTEQQVKKFQKDNRLKVNGIADSVTLKKLASEVKKASNNVVKIFLDPGHGGKDSGATGYGIKEKDVVLDIALKAAQVLRTKYLGVEVKLSRTTDKFVELTDRAKMANDWGADYFVSIHNNAFNGSTSGFESFIHNGKVSSKTVQKQKEIHQALMKKLGVANRGMKKANFSVLRNTNMPSILLEYLFIDNRKENSLLKSAKYRNWLGEITAHSIAQAFNLKKR